VVQLGPARAVVVKTEKEEPNLPIQTTSAVIRYGVVPVDGLCQGIAYALRLRYRGGSGHVVAKFFQVNIVSGAQKPLTTLDSKISLPQSNDFQVQLSNPEGDALDFTANAYYVELTLTVTGPVGQVPAFPPAVSVIQLVPFIN
jgi:hypothetical protein